MLALVAWLNPSLWALATADVWTRRNCCAEVVTVLT